MSTSLIHGRKVICGIEPDGTPKIVDDGAVLQRDGVIEAIGAFSELQNTAVDVVIGSEDHVICPGFVNAHHHVGLTPLQLGAPDLPLELWIVRRIASRFVDPYLDTLYSAFELLSSGVTTVQHLHGRAPAPVSRVLKVASEVIRAYQDVGMRVSYSYGLRDQNRIVYEDDQQFLKRLSPELAPLAADLLKDQTLTADEALLVFEELHAKYKRERRVKIQLAPVNFHWCTDRAIERTAETARRHGVPMHMHVLETALQREYAQRRVGGSVVKHLRKLGALGEDMTIGHGVWVTEDDIDILAETGTCVCHNCSSNLRLRSGIAPLNAYRQRGINIALGIDEAGLNDDRDMLTEMRLALRMHRVPGLDELDVPSANEIFKMATLGGAKTTPFGSTIGKLEVGAGADMVIFDWNQIAFPYLSDDVPVVDALVQRARMNGIHAVIVDGEVVLRDGHFTRVDQTASMQELARQMKLAPNAVDDRNRKLGFALLGYARNIYSDYLGAKRGQPFYRSNARD